MRTTVPSLAGFCESALEQGPAHRSEASAQPKEVWGIRVRLQLENCRRDLALFNLAIDSKLRGCDLVRLRVNDVCVAGHVRDRATVIQQKTSRPVQFEITEDTRTAVRDWMTSAQLSAGQYLFPSRVHYYPHISTWQYARIVHQWIGSAGLDSAWPTGSADECGR
jgi:integrase